MKPPAAGLLERSGNPVYGAAGSFINRFQLLIMILGDVLNLLTCLFFLAMIYRYHA
jgi:hypothetical protein